MTQGCRGDMGWASGGLAVASPPQESGQSTGKGQTSGTWLPRERAEEEKPEGRWEGPVSGALGTQPARRALESQLCGVAQ